MNERNRQKSLTLGAGCVLVVLASAGALWAAPVAVTQHHQIYQQDFDSLGTETQSWTNDSTLESWHLQRGTATPGSLAISHGNASGAQHFNFGSLDDPERALGARPGVVGGNPTGMSWGVQITNSSDLAIGGIEVTFDGEQWRRQGTEPNAIRFYYRVGGGSFDLGSNPGAWTELNSLAFTSPQLGSAAAIDGNAPANRQAGIHDRLYLDVPIGSDVWLGWSIAEMTDGNHGMAIDNLELEFLLPEPASGVIALAGIALVGTRRRKHRSRSA